MESAVSSVTQHYGGVNGTNNSLAAVAVHTLYLRQNRQHHKQLSLQTMVVQSTQQKVLHCPSMEPKTPTPLLTLQATQHYMVLQSAHYT